MFWFVCPIVPSFCRLLVWPCTDTLDPIQIGPKTRTNKANNGHGRWKSKAARHWRRQLTAVSITQWTVKNLAYFSMSEVWRCTDLLSYSWACTKPKPQLIAQLSALHISLNISCTFHYVPRTAYPRIGIFSGENLRLLFIKSKSRKKWQQLYFAHARTCAYLCDVN